MPVEECVFGVVCLRARARDLSVLSVQCVVRLNFFSMVSLLLPTTSNQKGRQPRCKGCALVYAKSHKCWSKKQTHRNNRLLLGEKKRLFTRRLPFRGVF